MLRDIKSVNQNIFLTVDTTCPLPRCPRPPTPKSPPKFELPPTIPEDHDQVQIQDHGKHNSHAHDVIVIYDQGPHGQGQSSQSYFINELL